MMSEYWIISAPGEKTCAQTFDTMNNLTSKQHNLCNNYKFHIPDLKVGTLDQLVGLSDDLGKLDSYVEQITRKVAVYLGEVLEDQRDKLHENLLANNSPGPPDEIPCRHHQRIKNLSLRHQRKHQHTHHQNKPQHYHLQHHHQLPQDIKAPGSGSGGSLNNLSTTHDESERDFDFVIAPQPGGCLCEECGVFAPPSTSATASTLMADECYSHTASSMLSATRSALSTMAAIATGSNLGGGSSVGGASTSAAAAAAHAHGGHPPAAAAASAPAKNSSASTLCSSAYFSTSAPTTSSSVHSMSRSNSKKLNNNTCSINHNKLSFRSGSHVSQLNLPQHQQQNQNQQYQQKRDLSSSSPLQSPTQKSCDSSDMDADGGNTTDGDPKSPNSARSSDLSETFDWWFNKPKRNSKKSRSSPVSSCCGSSSQGRSSPDTDNPEPPEFPLSPVYALPKQCCCR
ncbi:V-type proton ATPase subunit C isoform X3 [Drosophila miranda]|uniref:V-type proton ATPase subunit C isoform X3 n=1 Tax=Drosophila miranda TaxID=7229 RepID=UPI00143F2241|nr:V-type proton ATPase subunit C isoform X3 [Drosophila miranda]